jgi:hypothetical protein
MCIHEKNRRSLRKEVLLPLPDHTESIETDGLEGRLFREYFERMRYMCKTYTPLNYKI